LAHFPKDFIYSGQGFHIHTPGSNCLVLAWLWLFFSGQGSGRYDSE